MQIKDKVFLITGGSSGLGAACARLFAGQGGRILIADVKEEEGQALADELGSGAAFVKTNVTDEKTVQAAVEQAKTAFGGLHVNVNCAGIGWAGRVVSKSGPHSLDVFNTVIQVNLIGTFNVIRLAAGAIMENEPDEEGERGVIINTASVAAFEGQIGQAAYSASKGGIVGMTLPIAREMAGFGIRVVTIAPGLFDTPLLAGLPEPARVSLAQQIPFPSRLGRPEEFAALARHVVENAMINGEVIRLDGAIRMAPR